MAIDTAPEISVIVPTFDRPEAIERCIAALLAQRTEHAFEIVVVDNHPHSGSTAACAARFPSVRFIPEPTPGLSQARNTGLHAARGHILVTTDDDVLTPPDWLQTLTAPLFQALFDPTSTLAATTGNCLPVKIETPAEVLFEAYGGLRHGDTPATFDAHWMTQWRIGFPHLWRIGTTANAAFLASALRQLSPPKTQLAPFDTLLGAGTPAGAWEDIDCFYRLLLAGYRIDYIPQAAVLHAHREQLDALTRQLCAYRRGETAFLTLILLRHRDLRALGQAFLWIPYWRLRLLLRELALRARGKRCFPFRLLWTENLAYLAGPSALWRTHKHEPRCRCHNRPA
jgi:glycosyltransferase involved in cell wall biosynthesis